MTPFRYFGGKLKHLPELLPMMPRTEMYVEPFCGSAAVYFNKVPRSPVSILNDRDHRIVNFLKCLRHDPEELVRLITTTPYSRQEFYESRTANREADISVIEQPDMELARQTYVLLSSSWAAGLGKWSGWSRPAKDAGFPRRMPKEQPKHLQEIAEALLSAVIECGDGIELIRNYGKSENAFIYCDPPYVHGTRNTSVDDYGWEMTDADHVAFCEALNACTCPVMVSGYYNDIYGEHLAGWETHMYSITATVGARPGQTAEDMQRDEVVWLNYKPFPWGGKLL